MQFEIIQGDGNRRSTDALKSLAQWGMGSDAPVGRRGFLIITTSMFFVYMKNKSIEKDV